MSKTDVQNGDKELKQLMKILNEIGFENREEAEAKAIESLTDLEKIDLGTMTRLKMGEEEGLSVALSIAERYDLGWLKHRCEWLFRLRCSIGGESRREHVNIVSEKKKIQRGVLDRILMRKPRSEKGFET